MGAFAWTESHSVGVEAIDDQHKRLLALADGLFEAIMDGKGHDVLLGVLQELREHAHCHFTYEEDLLREHGYPEEAIQAHAKEHAALTLQVDEFIESASPESETLDIEVFDFLRDWTSEHLSRTDMQYKSFFESVQVN